MNGQPRSYRDVLPEQEHLKIFLRNMSKFDRQFCEAMGTGADFTLRLEVHGVGGQLVYCRVHHDGFDRPSDTPRTSRGGRNRKAIGDIQ